MTGSLASMKGKEIFGQAAAGTASGMLGAGRPRQAWIVVEQGWEYNDEFHYPEGEYPRSRLFSQRTDAEAECRRLCERFYAEQTPAEFEVDWSAYGPDRLFAPGGDEESVTWQEIREQGFPEPFFVMELTAPETSPS